MRRAMISGIVLVAGAACAKPEPARDWPAQHPLRAEARDEAQVALPSLAPRFDLPPAHEGGTHGGRGAHDAGAHHGGHGAHAAGGEHGGHGMEREVRP